MKLVGLMTVRNEEWVLGLSLRAALRFVDEMVVLDHASTDCTAALVERLAAEHPGRVRSLRESDPVWRESAWRQRLLEEGRAAGATHPCVLDADEVLWPNPVAGSTSGLHVNCFSCHNAETTSVSPPNPPAFKLSHVFNNGNANACPYVQSDGTSVLPPACRNTQTLIVRLLSAHGRKTVTKK